MFLLVFVFPPLFAEIYLCNLVLRCCKHAEENYKVIHILQHPVHSDFISAVLISILGSTQDLLIRHGRCTSCVQRHLAVVAAMHVGLDLGSLMCMNKIIPDLGLGRECAPLRMQMKRMSTEWSQRAGTLSHRPVASTYPPWFLIIGFR